MDFFKRLFKFGKSEKATNLDNLPFDLNIPMHGIGFNLKGMKLLNRNKGWVFACVTAIAEEISNIELRLMQRQANGESEQVFDHEILRLLNHVNPCFTSSELYEVTQSHQELEGNSFWFLAKDKQNIVQEIWPLRPDRVTFKQDKANPLNILNYIYRQRDGNSVEFQPEEIIHFKTFNAMGDYPFPIRGVGTLDAALLSVDTNDLSREWNTCCTINQ